MKTSILVILAPLLASAAVLPSSPEVSTVVARDFKEPVVQCGSGPELNKEDLATVAKMFANRYRTGEGFNYFKFTLDKGYDTYKDTKAYICNYGKKISDKEWEEIVISDEKVNAWMGLIDGKCGAGKPGWIDADVTQGNFGRGSKNDPMC
ncbi:unnamed protein product [Periconia digitata]|uniref:Uncharacterized protein n=1 Tax=Periconia digitata TaxID=1303443 RepID=A0A9W4UP06_9PLEO|nr:unnamed protein product [Periconia digitata]